MLGSDFFLSDRFKYHPNDAYTFAYVGDESKLQNVFYTFLFGNVTVWLLGPFCPANCMILPCNFIDIDEQFASYCAHGQTI